MNLEKERICIIRYEDIILEDACCLMDNSEYGWFDGDSRCIIVINPR